MQIERQSSKVAFLRYTSKFVGALAGILKRDVCYYKISKAEMIKFTDDKQEDTLRVFHYLIRVYETPDPGIHRDTSIPVPV
mgnify:CR=1 FL=1